MKTVSRRDLLVTGGLAGGALVLGVAPRAVAASQTDKFPVWLRVAPDNSVTILVPHCEMGQGAQTACAMMCAEELDADWSLVHVSEAPATSDYANGYMLRWNFDFDDWPFYTDPQAITQAKAWNLQVTGASGSVSITGNYGLRVAGAAAKAMLIAAAAQRWNIAPERCATRNSIIWDMSTGRRFSYGELATDAAQLPIPGRPAMKSKFTLIGRSPPRADIPSKVDGTAVYGIDITLPGLLFAAIKAAPVHGGKLKSVDPAPANAKQGVKAVVKLDDAVAVIADKYWRAKTALEALQPVFSDGGKSSSTSASIFAALGNALDNDASLEVDDTKGRGRAALASAAKVIEAEYQVPFLAHAAMEPLSCTAMVRNGKCELWAGTQDPLHARATAADALHIDPRDVTVHTLPLGGGFGRRLGECLDFITQGVLVAKAASPNPVKLIWSREEDIQRDYYRPAVVSRLKGGLDQSGKPIAWVHRYTHRKTQHPAASPIYDIPHQDIRFADVSSHVRTGPWRSVAYSQHIFFTECFIDELATAAGQDPFIFRRDLLGGRARTVLETCARHADWGAPLGPRRGRGIAIVQGWGTVAAQVADITIDAAGTVKVDRIVCLVDCGTVVHPDCATAQVEGGILFALSAALYGEITIDQGRVQQSNFTDYPVVRMADAPVIDVKFIARENVFGGLGEPGVPPVAPAVANAIFAATGQRVRRLPLAGQTFKPLRP